MNLSLLPLESKNLLLRQSGEFSRSVIIGQHIEGPRAYYACHVDTGDPIHIFIVVSQTITPEVWSHLESKTILVGHDQSLSVVDSEEARIKRASELEAIFFEFLDDNLHSQTLAVHELGIVALSHSGDELWRYLSDDIVENWEITNDRICLTIAEGNKPVFLSLLNGSDITL